MGAGGDYDEYAANYASYVAWREQRGADNDPLGIMPQLLSILGDIEDRVVLDAGCGDGYLARLLHKRGARVVGIDLSSQLVALAEERNPSGEITYRVADLAEPLPEYERSFDAIASYLVLNDVANYRGFASTLATMLAPGGQLVLAINNPYGAVIRKHVTDYFASGTVSPYRGLWQSGIKVYHHHRTLEEYLDAFLDTGLRLTKLADLSEVTSHHGPETILPEGIRFARFMILAFAKPRGFRTIAELAAIGTETKSKSPELEEVYVERLLAKQARSD